MDEYPQDAYSPDGVLWWLLSTWPGKKQRFGVEPKVAAWLHYNAKPGDILSMSQLRSAIPNDDLNHGDNTQEHFNRRFRNLRGYGWLVPSKRDDDGLAPDQYRFDKEGDPIWLGKAQFARPSISARVRRQVLDKDGHRCIVCGVGAGEEYPGEPGTNARLTLGHFQAGALAGMPPVDNLRTECSRCNEPLRDEASSSETVEDIWPSIRRLRAADKRRLSEWLALGRRSRNEVDLAYDAIRALPPGQRDDLRERLGHSLGGPGPLPDDEVLSEPSS